MSKVRNKAKSQRIKYYKGKYGKIKTKVIELMHGIKRYLALNSLLIKPTKPLWQEIDDKILKDYYKDLCKSVSLNHR